MPLEVLSDGNIFEIDTEAIVNPVNCVGVMGRGLAYQFRRRYPKNYETYVRACRQHRIQPGLVQVYTTDPIVMDNGGPRYIVNFPTKRHWRDRSRLTDIESTLAGLAYEMTRLDIKSVAMPALGCGLGGLLWRDVLPLIEWIAAHPDMKDRRTVVFEPRENV